MRVRLLVLSAAVAAGLLAGCGGGAAPRSADRAGARKVPRAPMRAAPARGVALPRAVGSTIVVRFAGPVLPGYVRRALRDGRAAGVVLFEDNVVDPAQLRRLTGAVRAASRGRGLVLADQEGGTVRNVPWAGPRDGARVQAATGTARSQSRTAGRELRRLGVTVALAPVADVGPGALAARSFSSDAGSAASAVAAAVRGFRAGGVAPTAKHFPGLGGAAANTDDAPVTVAGRPELRPFAAAIDAGVPLVMLSHATYPALDPDRIASQSRAIVEGLLRRKLGFRGVAITDSIEAEGALRTGSVGAAAERSLRAGVDLILTTGRGSYLPVTRRLLAAGRRSPAFAARLREAAGRVERLQRSLR